MKFERYIVECSECGTAVDVQPPRDWVRLSDVLAPDETAFEELIESHDAWMHRAKLAEKALQVARGEEPTPIYPGDPAPDLQS